MTERYAIRGISARQEGKDSRPKTWLVPLFVLAAALTGCRNEASKETSSSAEAVRMLPAGQAETAEPNDSALPAKITVENPVVDLKDIGTDSKVSGKFTFISSGKGTLRIEKVHSCCGVSLRGVEPGQEYPPGERGTLDFDYATGSSPLSNVKRELRLQTNDPDQKFVTLTIKANIVRRVEVDPVKLRLFLKQENAGCGDLTIRSLDGKPFSITSFKSTANSIAADFDPNVSATEFVLKPQADLEKLQRNVRGVVSVNLTHPECGNVRVMYDVLPEFTINPAHLMVFNMRPGQPIQRDVWVLSNYRDDFDVESVSSQKGYIKLVEKTKVRDRYQLRIEIMPPPQDSDKNVEVSPSDGQNAAVAPRRNDNVLAADMLEVKIKDGDTLSIPFRGFYVSE